MKFMFNAILNKKSELFISLAMVLALLLIASVSMYYLEHRAQPDAFSSIAATMWWGVATLTTVGYGDIYPITTAGKVLGGFIAILGVGLFALPAGIIASSFVEEMELLKHQKKIQQQTKQLLEAFEVEYYVPVIRIKEQLGLDALPRKWLSMNDIKYKLGLTESSVLEIISSTNQFRIRSVKLQDKDSVGVEYTPSNRHYGQYIDRGSTLTVINMHANIQAFFGHFSYAVAHRLDANYISNEHFSKVNFNRDNRLNLIDNAAYLDAENEHPVLADLKKDIQQLVGKQSICVLFVNAASNENLLQFNIGGVKGENNFENAVFFEDIDQINLAFEAAKSLALEQGMKVLKHQKNGAPSTKHISWYIHKSTQCQLLLLHINVGLLKKKATEYYLFIDKLSQIISLLNK